MNKKTVIMAMCGVIMTGLMVGWAGAVVLLTTEDARVESWGAHSGGEVVLAAGDGAYAGERIWHSYLKFHLPALDPGESFSSAQLQIYPYNFWSWTAADPYASVAAFRAWQTVNTWDPNDITWQTQPTKFQLATWPLVDEGDLLDTILLGYADMYAWRSFNVLAAMAPDTTVSFVTDCDRDYPGTEGGGGIWYHSYEQGWGPRIEYQAAFDPAGLDITEVDAAQDCYVDSWDPNTVYNGTDLLAGNFETGRGRSTLLRFVLPTLGPGESFHNAYLNLYQESVSGDQADTISFPIHFVISPWDETTCTYSTMPTADVQVGTLVTSSSETQTRVRAKVLDAVAAAGSGGTVDLMISGDILEAAGGQKNVALWKSKDAAAEYRPKLELVLTLPVDCTPPLQADLTGDCAVNLEDLAIMISEWLDCNWSDPGLCP